MKPERWKWLWIRALLVAVVNALVVVWRQAGRNIGWQMMRTSRPRRMRRSFPTRFDYLLLTPLLTWWTYQHFGDIRLHRASADGLLFYAGLLILFAASARRYVPTCISSLPATLQSRLPLILRRQT